MVANAMDNVCLSNGRKLAHICRVESYMTICVSSVLCGPFSEMRCDFRARHVSRRFRQTKDFVSQAERGSVVMTLRGMNAGLIRF